MNMTKQKFYEFAIMMRENSKILFENDKKHTSVYLGGYVLEAYIKILLISKGEDDYIGHLGDSEFLKKFKRIISLHPELADNLLQETSLSYPKCLFNGRGNNTTKASWKIGHRYQVENWTDQTFCQNIQAEVDIVETALNHLRIDGKL